MFCFILLGCIQSVMLFYSHWFIELMFVQVIFRTSLEFFFACRSCNNIRILTSGLGRLKTSEHLFMYAHILIQFLFIEQFHREFYSLFFPLCCKLSGLTRVVNINVYDSSCCFSHSQRNIHRETWWKKIPPKVRKTKTPNIKHICRMFLKVKLFPAWQTINMELAKLVRKRLKRGSYGK